MTYTPLSAVWELTMACNMRCKHCGSACSERLPDELTTEEALSLSDDLADLGLRHITLSGGEPLLKKDWDRIARRLSGRGIEVTMISNGWLVDEVIIDRARSSGLSVIGMSLDGLEETHDFIRKPGAFQRVRDALDSMAKKDYRAGIITTLMKRNLPELPQLKDILMEHGVRRWQLQFGNPMGNFAEHREELVEPADVPTILEFAGTVHREGRIIVDLADCLGYFTRTDTTIRQAGFSDPLTWQGCAAGKHVIGIRHNGDICGCNAIREEKYIEGNIRKTPLYELWTGPGAFAWNRERTRDSLTGFCRLCQHGDICLAGCTSTRLSLGGSEGEFRFCAYRILIEDLFPKIDGMKDPRKLAQRAEKAMELGIPEIAHRCLARASQIEPGNMDILADLRRVESKLKATQGISCALPAG